MLTGESRMNYMPGSKNISSLDIMDSVQSSPIEQSDEINKKSAENDIDRIRIEAMVTPEQEFTASIAKKRRTFTKKRSKDSIKPRDQTPLKEIDDKTTTDEEIVPVLPKPKTPERPRRRRFQKSEKRSKSASAIESENTESEGSSIITVKRNNSIPKQILEELRKHEYLADTAQEEIKNLYNKTKKGLTAVANRGREKFKKVNKDKVKRSQSAPFAFTEDDLIESFRKAQLLDVDIAPIRRISESEIDSGINITPEQVEICDNISPKQLRPEARQLIRQRKKSRPRSTSKVVEILDPKTSNVVATQVMTQPDFKLLQLFSILKTYTLRELIINYKIFKHDMKHECERIRILWNRCMMDLFLVIIFCGLGGFIFKFVEGNFENFYKCGVKRVKRDFIDLLWMRSHNLREEDWKSLARNKLRMFEDELHTAHEAGMKTYSGQRSWSFMNSVVYCLTIITTIGYGHIYPETRTGKILTIVYAIIGIPLFLLALTDFGKLFTRSIKYLWSFVRRLYYTGSCRRMRKTAHVKEFFKGAQMMYEIATFRRPSMFVDPESIPPDPEEGVISDGTPTTPAISNFEIDDEFNLPISLAIFILIAYINLGAFVYSVWEDWTFFEAFYFVFISMSTIGFGDIVPKDPACMIVLIVYLVFGLALMSMCINVVQLKLSDTFKQASSKLGATMGITVNEEDGSIITVPPDDIEIAKVHDPTAKSIEDEASSMQSVKLNDDTVVKEKNS